MTLQQVLTILRARWAIMALIMLTVLCATIAGSLLAPKYYYSQTQVVIDLKSDPLARDDSPLLLSPSYVATQVDIVRSDRMGLQVVDALGLVNNAQARERWLEATGGNGSIRHYYASLLLRDVAVKPTRNSTVLTIGFTGRDPEFSAAVANAFAQAYIQTNIEMKVEPARQQRDWFVAQRTKLREQLDDAHARLSAYQRDNNIVSADERLDVENRRLQELATSLTNLSTAAAADQSLGAQARQALADGRGSTLPEVMNNQLVVQLKATLSRQQARYQEQSAVRGERHPQILQLKKEIRSLQARIAAETRNIVASLGSQTLVSSTRLSGARTELNRQQQKVLALKVAREELNILQRDVNNAQTAYDNVVQRLNQSTLESQTDRANLFVLSSAEPAAAPIRPSLSTNLPLGLFFGALLAIGSVLAFELVSRRVHSPADLQDLIDAPVVGSISRVSDRVIEAAAQPATNL